MYFMQNLLTITGCVEAAAADEAPGNCFENALHAAQLHNLEHEILTGAEVNRRFPGYSFPDDYKVPTSPPLSLPHCLLPVPCKKLCLSCQKKAISRDLYL
jgi:hypothetical protein